MAPQSESSATPAVMIVDAEGRFARSCQSAVDALVGSVADLGFKFFAAGGDKEARALIADSQYQVVALFLCPIGIDANGVFVVRAARAQRPQIPVYLVMDEGMEQAETCQELISLGASREILSKSISLRDLLTRTGHASFQSLLPEEQSSRGEELDSELSSEDASFVPIRAQDFISGKKVFFDVYVRLSSSRYLKLLQAGDAFSRERIEGYLKKGISHFHIRKEAQEAYVAYCNQITGALLTSPKVSLSLKSAQHLNHGEQLMGLLKTQGVTEANLTHAREFISNTRSLVRELSSSPGSFLEQFVSDMARYDHAAGVAMLGGILANVLEIQMDRPVQIVGMACMFHDLGLMQMPEEFVSEDESTMGPELKALYRTHPEKGAEMLRAIRGIDPTVIQAVSQHHLRHGDAGFPERDRRAPIHRIAELVGICDEFNQRARKAQESGSSADLLAELEAQVFPLFSRQIVYAFRTAFFPKRSASAAA